MSTPSKPRATTAPRHGVARVLSKMGLCSRAQAALWVAAGRVRVNGSLVRDPEFPVRQGVDRIAVDGVATAAAERIVVMLNKPRGLVTTASDEQGRTTVYSCFANATLPWLAPVGRLDQASEGLLLFTNDPVWAARITDPATGPMKAYHVQVDTLPDAAMLAALEQGIDVGGEKLAVHSARLLRAGQRNAWLEIVLDEGRNRQIRRLLAKVDVKALRLLRVSIGGLVLGQLPKGQWRRLTTGEIDALAPGR
jgi:23S rRNA pseudouridine2605 synthase